MKFRAPILLLTMALPLALFAAEEAPKATPKPSLLKRMMKTVGLAKDPTTTTATGFKGLEIGLAVDPAQVKVGEVKQIKATVTLANHSKKIAQLEFPTTQRIEILVKSKEGKTIEQWSEDQAFSNEPTMVTINPNERLEYAVSVATRDMVADQTYTVEAFFPNFDQLRKSITVAAVGANAPAVTPPGATPAPGAPATPEPKKKHKKL
ncbi:MAG: BsuPI-related putative proteinase inhibitor [Chthoniobacter sp.]|uniref:BsuPI-related putative proteinase inhibitor n=1 Tax=Chthoniobacter sp. TaxID=2510640 RepID=UPI0032A78BA0